MQSLLPRLTAAVAVRKGTELDRYTAIYTLGRAFEIDPVLRCLLRQDRYRARAYLEFFDIAYTEQTLPFGEIYVAEDGNAVALWTPPGKWRMSMARQIALLPTIVRCTSVRGTGRAFEAFAKMERQHPADPHYYLFAVGTDPSKQKLGYGAAVLAPTLARCDAEGVGAYLECSSDANLPFYQALGFQVTGVIDLGPGGPPWRTMWRAPRAS